MQTTVKLYSFSYTDIRTYLAAAAFIIGNIVVPQLVHLMPQGGLIWLPIYFFTLIAAYKYGWRTGLLTAVASPLVNFALFGMPGSAMLPAIMLKSSILAGAAAYAASRYGKVTLPALTAVVLTYQITGTAFEWLMTGSLATALQDFRMGLPGICFQILGGWACLRFLMRK
ncbi:MAG: ECF transporter S component [Bacteroidales bacterium]|nr:ECF transporter S component [Bacteroidales bacterium]